MIETTAKHLTTRNLYLNFYGINWSIFDLKCYLNYSLLCLLNFSFACTCMQLHVGQCTCTCMYAHVSNQIHVLVSYKSVHVCMRMCPVTCWLVIEVYACTCMQSHVGQLQRCNVHVYVCACVQHLQNINYIEIIELLFD